MLKIRDGLLIVLLNIILLIHMIWEFFSKKVVKEFSALIAVYIFFYLSAYVLRWIDPTAGTYDIGVLQIINLSFVLVATFNAAAWSIFRVIWPELGYFMKYRFTNAFKQLTPWEKLKFCLSVLFFIQLELLLASIIVR